VSLLGRYIDELPLEGKRRIINVPHKYWLGGKYDTVKGGKGCLVMIASGLYREPSEGLMAQRAHAVLTKALEIAYPWKYGSVADKFPALCRRIGLKKAIDLCKRRAEQ